MAVLIYKLLLPAEWAELQTQGHFAGSPFDLSSGFIHLSAREQVAATALRVFPTEPELVLVAVDTDVVEESLRWEPTRDKGVFPHLYAPLPLSAVAAVHHVAGAAAVPEVLPG